MAPFQARIVITNSLCDIPATGQFKIIVGPNHGWNSTTIIPQLATKNIASIGYWFLGAAYPFSYNIKYPSSDISGWTGTVPNYAEICEACPPLVTNGTSTWTNGQNFTSPDTAYSYFTPTVNSAYTEVSTSFTHTYSGPVGTYTFPATITGDNE